MGYIWRTLASQQAEYSVGYIGRTLASQQAEYSVGYIGRTLASQQTTHGHAVGPPPCIKTRTCPPAHLPIARDHGHGQGRKRQAHRASEPAPRAPRTTRMNRLTRAPCHRRSKRPHAPQGQTRRVALVMFIFMADLTLFMCMAEGSEKPKSEWSVKMTCKGGVTSASVTKELVTTERFVMTEC